MLKQFRTKSLVTLLLILALAITGCSDKAKTEAATDAVTDAAVTEATTQTTTEAANTEAPAKVEIEKGVVDIAALKAEGKPIMLQFSQDGCPPCEQMLPYVKSLQDEFKDTVIVRYVDARENTPLLIEYPVQFTPTQIFIDAEGNFFQPTEAMGFETGTKQDGTEVPLHVGLLTEDQLRTILNELKGE